MRKKTSSKANNEMLDETYKDEEINCEETFKEVTAEEITDRREQCKEEEQGKEETENKETEVGELDAKIKELQEAADNYKDLYQRLLAEFDNYKKRTVKERETARNDAKIEIITKFLPVIDNIERAEKSFETEAAVEALKQGIEMVFKQIMDVMESEDVTSIKAEGEEFNPEYHNAVMHIEDEACDINVIVEEFQKGYKYKDKVIRYSMVKVAN